MKAVRITNPGEIEVCTLQEPPLGPEEVRVKVHVLGLCGNAFARSPAVMGRALWSKPMLQSGRVDTENLVTHRFDLLRIGEALRFWEKNPLKVTKILTHPG